jgi:quinoprotein relay system zinc metallohydrolase 2
MWEVLLTACLLSDPGQCRSERTPAGGSYEACRDEADRLSRKAFGPEWRAQSWPCVAAGETPAFNVTEIAPGVWVHKGAHAEPDATNGGDVANLGFVIGSDAVAAIDAGSTPETARALLDAIRARTSLPVRWLILTHMHPDHSLGAQAFKDAGAKIAAHAKLGPALTVRFDGYVQAMARETGRDESAFRMAEPDMRVADTARIDLGGRQLTLAARPVAHTDNDLTVEDSQTGVRFMGDLLFMDHTPAIDGSIRGWLALLDALAAEEAPLVVPGHGPVAVAWPDSADRLRDYLEAIARQTRAAIAEGRPMLAAVAEIGQDQRPGWLLFDWFNQRNATAAFHELEWE